MANKISKWLKQAQQHATVGHLDEAERLCHKILDVSPDHADAQLELGRVLYYRRRLTESIEILEPVLQREPGNTDARILLIYGYVEGGDHARAIALAHEIREHSKNPGELLAAYRAFDTLCDWENSQQIQARILDLGSDGKISMTLMPSLLMLMNAVPDISPERMFQLHRVWGEQQEREARKQQFPVDPRPPASGKLKVGYLSGDFCQHPVGHFIQSQISHHDRNRFEVFCYAILPIDDARTDCIREAADHFIDVTQLSPYEIARRIHQDGIHIMVDLSGHTSLSRVHALAYRPAPVQMTYLGYPNTTGLSTIDYRITDAFAEDTEQGTQYTEKLLFMPQSFLCSAEFMQDVPRIEVSPATRNGHITFGSFNHVRKLNPETIALWSRILHGVQGSKLVIKGIGCDKPIVRDNILAEFARHDIDADRIQFHGLIERHAEHAAIYNEVDIALDSFPYNGTTTTCETLWMGVPVVTLVGLQHVQRTSYSILKNIGLDATIAHTPDEYVEKAINLSKNPDNLSVLRKCLPTLLRLSPLGQPEVFTRQIEELYLHAWQEKTGIPVTRKKTLRLIHNLARSGSTLMCKCLGSMQGVNLLSEIHPQAVNHFNPLDQAHEWFGLLTPEDVASLQNTAPSFVEAIRLIEQRSSERDEALVIRDWAHLDFAGAPFLPMPAFRLTLAESLAGHFELKQIAFVRHPIDLWLSLSRLEIMQQPIASGRFGIDAFIHGYLRFAQQCAPFGLIRYEDFTCAPEEAMQRVCENLDIPYDVSFIEKWSAYTTITGDVVSTRGGNEIKQLKRRDVSDETLEAFDNNPEYAQLLDALGYAMATCS